MKPIPLQDSQLARAAALVAFRSTPNHPQSRVKLSETMERASLQEPGLKDEIFAIAKRDLRLFRAGIQRSATSPLCQGMEEIALRSFGKPESVSVADEHTKRRAELKELLSKHAGLDERVEMLDKAVLYVNYCVDDLRSEGFDLGAGITAAVPCPQLSDLQRKRDLETERENLINTFSSSSASQERLNDIENELNDIECRISDSFISTGESPALEDEDEATYGNGFHDPEIDFSDEDDDEFNNEIESDDDDFDDDDFDDDDFDDDDFDYEESSEDRLASLYAERASIIASSNYKQGDEPSIGLQQVEEEIEKLEYELTPPTRLISLSKVGELKRELVCGVVCLSDTDNEGNVKHLFLTQNKGLISHQSGKAARLPESTVAEIAAYDLVNNRAITVKPDHFTGTAHVVANLRTPDVKFEKRDGFLVLDTMAGALFVTHLPADMPSYATSIGAVGGITAEGRLGAVYPFADASPAKQQSNDQEPGL